MMRIRTASASAPLLTEAIELRRVDPDDRPVVAMLARLSRGLSVMALGGCALLALVAVHGAQKPARATLAPQPVAERAQPAAPAAAAPAPDVRLVYGNPDELRGANPLAEGAPREAPAPVAAVPQPIKSVSTSVAAVEPAAAAPGEAADAGVAAPAVSAAAAPPSDSVDLNTASVEQLNGLNAGMIGRTIVRGRPYGSPDELVQRRILNRADFARIRDRVVVGSAER